MLKGWFLLIPASRSCCSLNHLALNLTASAALSIKRSFALALVDSRLTVSFDVTNFFSPQSEPMAVSWMTFCFMVVVYLLCSTHLVAVDPGGCSFQRSRSHLGHSMQTKLSIFDQIYVRERVIFLPVWSILGPTTCGSKLGSSLHSPFVSPDTLLSCWADPITTTHFFPAFTMYLIHMTPSPVYASGVCLYGRMDSLDLMDPSFFEPLGWERCGVIEIPRAFYTTFKTELEPLIVLRDLTGNSFQIVHQIESDLGFFDLGFK
ncbi:hypothetical protein PIB30_001658 [Stylosanthes scabra]|uniref:Uncharacterized protein n=1 Tax=Stylosanthes scabra TaxID=79078 RepID=A0ABU6T2E5_9FABA|nr:hypothetical protein [Stylosanthes scabra]